MKILFVRRGLALVALGLVILSLTVSCADEILPLKGQLMLVLSTNMAPPKDFDSFHLRVVEEGATVPLHDLDYSLGGSQPAKFPATFGVVAGTDPNKTFHITLEASRGGAVRLRRDVLTRVPDGRVAALPLPLDGLCSDQIECPLDANGEVQTCIAGSCQVAKVAVESLSDYSAEAVFGGGNGQGDGFCFNTLQCFADGKVATVRNVDCSIELERGGQGLNVAVLGAATSEGICASNGCLLTLDRDPFTGPVVTGWRDVGDRVLLPRAICERSLSLVTTTACATKTTATCGAWSSVQTDAPLADASLPFDAPLADAGGGSFDGGEGGPASPVSPASITFVDGDMSQGSVDGTVTVGRAADESTITAYKLYWASGPTQKLDLIATLPKTGQNLTHVLTGAVFAGATHLLAVSVAGNSELPGAISTGPIDNFTRNVALTKGSPVVSRPNVLVDSTTDHLLITGFDKGEDNGTPRNRPSLVRCNLDGSSCSYIDISSGESGDGNEWKMGAALDLAASKLLVISGRSRVRSVPMLFRCNLDGTGCVAQELAPKAPLLEFDPDTEQNTCPISLVVDSTHQKLYAVTSARIPSAPGPIVRVYTCEPDGTKCEASIVDYGWGGGCPAAALNEADSTLIITRPRYPTYASVVVVPSLLRCSLDLSNCERKDIDPNSAGTTLSFTSTSIAIDTKHQKLLTLAHQAGGTAIWLYRCNFDGEGCTSVELAPGPKFPTPAFPSIVIDSAHDTFLAFAGSNLGNFFFRCNFDGTGCATVGIDSKSSNLVSAALSEGRVYTVSGAITGYDLASFTAY